MHSTHRTIPILAASIALLLTAQAAVLATTATRTSGPVTQVKSVTDGSFAGYSTSPAYADLDGMQMKLTVPEGQEAQLLITFSAASLCHDLRTDHGWCLVKVVVDGHVATPGPVVWDATVDGNAYEVHSMQWVTGTLSAGDHNVRVMVKIDAPGRFQFGARTLTVLRSRV